MLNQALEPPGMGLYVFTDLGERLLLAHFIKHLTKCTGPGSPLLLLMPLESCIQRQ